MAKSVRFNFSKGIYGNVEPRVVGDGYATVIHNVDLRSGIAKPAKAPVLDTGISAPSNTVWMWEFLGSWYLTDHIRDWAGEKVGSMTRVYFTKPGQSPVTLPPQKIVDGVQAKLGTTPPAEAPGVEPYQGSDTSVINASGEVVTVAELGLKKVGTYRYRLAGKDSSGEIVATSNQIELRIEYPDTQTCVITWATPDGVSEVDIYRSDTGGELAGGGLFLISAGTQTVSPWTDDSGHALDFSKPFPLSDTEKVLYKYLYTYIRDINGHLDESGPSPLSESIEGAKGRVITFEEIGGGEDADAGNTHNNPVATPIAGTSLPTPRCFITSGGKTTVCTSSAHGLTSGNLVLLKSAHAGDSAAQGRYQVTVPTSPGRPAGFTVEVRPNTGGNIPTGAHTFKLVGVRGWNISQVYYPTATPDAYGGMTLPSTAVSVTIAAGDTLNLTCTAMDVDAYYLFMDDVFVEAYEAFDFSDRNALYLGPANAWPNKPSLPATDTSSTCVFKINATLDIYKNHAGGQMPTYETGGGVTITTGAHGITVGQKRSVRLSGFATNTSLNKLWVSEATGATTVKIGTVMVGASETGTLAEFSKVSSGSASDETSNLKARRLYRIGDVTDFLRVAEIEISEGSYTDTVKTVDLGPACPSFYEANGMEVIFAPPPEGLVGIVANNAVLAGIDGHKIRWTPAGYPDAWPEVFYVQAYYPVKIVPIGGSWIIFCAGKIGRLEMGSPTQVFFQWLPIETGCVAPYSIQATPKGIIFMAQDGLYLFDVGSNEVVPLFPDRMTRRFFLSPSVPTAAYGHWWMPGNKSFAYTFLARDLPGSKRAGVVTQLDNQPTFPDGWTVPRSFYTNGRYYLYYWDQTNYPQHGMLEVNLTGAQPVATSVGLRPMASHVTAVGNAYLLLPGSSGTLSAVLDLEGSTPDTDTGAGSLNVAAPAAYRFGDELGTASRIHIRTGPICARLEERAWWKEVSFHGKGRGAVKVWLDGWDITAAGAAAFVASETPSQARVVKLPRGSTGYSIDLEITGEIELLAVELTFDPMPSEG